MEIIKGQKTRQIASIELDDGMVFEIGGKIYQFEVKHGGVHSYDWDDPPDYFLREVEIINEKPN